MQRWCKFFVFAFTLAYKDLLFSTFKQHLNLAGINAVSKIWEIGKTERFLFDRLATQPVNYIVYIITNDFLDQLNKSDYDIINEANGLTAMLKQPPNNIIFLLLNNETSLEARVKAANFTCIDLKEQKSYYLSVFALIKKLLPTNNVDKNINEFKKQYESLLKHPTTSLLLKKDDSNISIKASVNYFSRLKKVNIAIILLLIVSLNFIIFIFYKYIPISRGNGKTKYEIHINENHPILPNTVQYNQDSHTNLSISKKVESVNDENAIQKTMLLNVPVRNINFTGRKEALKQIENQLNRYKFGIITQAISGLGGIGKTQLAAEFVYQATEKNTYDIVFWVMAEDTASISNSYRVFADQLHIDVRGLRLKEIQALVHRQSIKGKNIEKVLFVLDDVATYDKIHNHLENLGKQWPNNYSIHVLITTRSQYWHLSPLILNTFTPMEASNYVKKHLPNESDNIIKLLIQKLHYFPLALSQAVAYVKEHTNIEDYLKLYKKNKLTYLNKLSDDRNQKTLWHALAIVLPKLSNNAKEILYASAYINADDIPIDFFSNLSVEDRVEAIKDLRKHSLVTLTNLNSSFFIHRMLQDIVKLHIRNEKDEMEDKWINRAMDLLEDKFGFNYITPNKWDLWQQYLSHAHATAKNAVKMQGKTFQRGMKLYFQTAMMVTFIQRELRVAVKMWSSIKQIITEKYTGSSADLIMADIDVSFGCAWRMLGEYDKSKACIENAIAIYQQFEINTIPKVQVLTSDLKLIPFHTTKLDDRIKYDLSYALMRLGNLYREIGQYDKALINYNKSLSIIEKYKNISTAQYYYVDVLLNLGYMHIYAGNLIEAERFLTNAKNIGDKIYINYLSQVHPSQAYVCTHMAMLLHHLGKFSEAKKFADMALSIRTLAFADNHHMLGLVNFLIGIIDYSAGDIKQAKINLERAEEIYNMNFKKQDVRHVLFYLNLHHVYEYTKQYNKALNYLSEALAIASKNYGDRMHAAVSFRLTRAECWPKLDKVEHLSYWQKALNITALLFGDNHYQTARSHYLLAQALQKHGEKAKARIHYEKALVIMKKERIPHPNLTKYYQKNITAIQTKLGELQQQGVR